MVSQTGRLLGQQCWWSSQQVAAYASHCAPQEITPPIQLGTRCCQIESDCVLIKGVPPVYRTATKQHMPRDNATPVKEFKR